MEEKKTAIITVRFTPTIKKHLEKAAKDGFRTLSQEVEMRVIKSLGGKSK